MTSFQECATQGVSWMNKGSAPLGEGEKAKETVGTRILSVGEVDGARARGCDDSSVAVFSHEAHIERKRVTHHLTPRASCQLYSTRQARSLPAEAAGPSRDLRAHRVSRGAKQRCYICHTRSRWRASQCPHSSEVRRTCPKTPGVKRARHTHARHCA